MIVEKPKPKQFKADRLQMIVVAKKLSVLQLFISRMPKMCAILQLVSAPLNPIPIAEHFRTEPTEPTTSACLLPFSANQEPDGIHRSEMLNRLL